MFCIILARRAAVSLWWTTAIIGPASQVCANPPKDVSHSGEASPSVGTQDDFDPAAISERDAIECRLDAPSYTGFALSISGDDGIAKARHWRKIDNGNPFLNEYELPETIRVAGDYSTRHIAFSASAILAVLDLPDPAPLAAREGITNAYDPEPLIAELLKSGKVTRAEIEADMPFRKFLGKRIVSDETRPATGDDSFGTHTVITRSLSNASTHPGKTFYGCSYRIELIGKDGKPL